MQDFLTVSELKRQGLKRTGLIHGRRFSPRTVKVPAVSVSEWDTFLKFQSETWKFQSRPFRGSIQGDTSFLAMAYWHERLQAYSTGTAVLCCVQVSTNNVNLSTFYIVTCDFTRIFSCTCAVVNFRLMSNTFKASIYNG